MKVLVGVHTRAINLKFLSADFDQVRAGNPVPVGKRSWFVMERDGGIMMERAAFGISPSRMPREPLFTQLSTTCDTIVRCQYFEREIEQVRKNQLFIAMPPHHLWPWMHDSKSRLRTITPEMWRWHLVQELNARVVSATRHHVDLPSNLPDWVSRMLTRDEWDRVHRNEELLR